MNKHLNDRFSIFPGAFFFVLACGPALARVIDVTLEQLVQRSSYIAYGRSVLANVDSSSNLRVVQFAPILILKGKRSASGEQVTICNDRSDVESYDLSVIDQPYIVFARAAKDCYLPVQRLRSVVKVDGDIAFTGNIAGQPQTQSLSGLLKKIESLVVAK